MKVSLRTARHRAMPVSAEKEIDEIATAWKTTCADMAQADEEGEMIDDDLQL